MSVERRSAEDQSRVARRSPGADTTCAIGKRALTDGLVQFKEHAGAGGDIPAATQAIAAGGVVAGGGRLPYVDRIQGLFGRHDVTKVSAHVGGPATVACDELGATAYATGNRIAFAAPPDLHTATHEAAHVVQQRGGVSLKDGVGQVDDPHERHADAVADRVVAGQSAEDLLDGTTGGSPAVEAVQRRALPGDEPHWLREWDDPLFNGHLETMRLAGEFRQRSTDANEKTLHRASRAALETVMKKDKKLAHKWNLSVDTLEKRAISFRDDACNIQALFFIEHAAALRMFGRSMSYNDYKKFVLESMKDYFVDALRHERIDEKWYVLDNTPLDQEMGCNEHHSPSQKADRLLKCEGRLIRIHVSTHFFIGRVKAGHLYAHDSQGDQAGRSGVFNLRDVGRGTETYKYLKNILVSASPERTPNPDQCEPHAEFFPPHSK